MPAFDVTLTRTLPDRRGAFALPYWTARDDVPMRDVSSSLAAVGAASEVRLARPLPAARRADPGDPTSPAQAVTRAEHAAGLDRMVRLRAHDPEAARDALQRLRSRGMVAEISPVRTFAFRLDRWSDPVLKVGGRPGSWALEAVDAGTALALSPGHPAIRVAVLDSGISRDHPEFEGKVAGGYDFVSLGDGGSSGGLLIGDVTGRDPDWDDGPAAHGSHVAGTIGALGLAMPVGAAGLCSLLGYRVLGTALENGARIAVGSEADIQAGIKEAADRGASVINLSLGLGAQDGLAPHARAIRYARLRNVVTVAASGNHGSDTPVYPGAVPGVITVGAIDQFGRVAPFSGWGPHLDVTAPGADIYSADLNGGYRYRDGTSHAAPFVSATAALIVALGHERGATFRESTIRRLIRDSARIEGRLPDPRGGVGVLNMGRALQAAEALIEAHRRGRGTDERRPPWPFGFGPEGAAAAA